MSECSHDCSNCSSSTCGERQDIRVKQNNRSNVKKVIGIVSGKGGVGKSFITSILASSMNKKGHSVAILDADITGPSIPKAFGVNDKAFSMDGVLLEPVISKSGIKMMSINLLLEKDSEPVVWRGPVIAGTVKQFWSDVAWEDVDYMFVDMPPGTGDVPLTIFQSLPVDRIIVVTSPQQLVSMIVSKAVKMAQMMNVPIIGIVENMSYLECPNCAEKIKIFGESNVDNIAKEYDLEVLAKLPLNTENTKLCDSGRVDEINCDLLEKAISKIENI
ncbi:MAG: Mrp/NBP35 family ATP-binding protein [Clostridia bacterium]|nr:Mrp/NBP35 family ATP-binding protein [Clostridia bacterium]